MKDPLGRAKVVVRRLPPAISQAAAMEQIDSRFSGRYNWFWFSPGKSSCKDMRHSRLYINFNGPEDVVEFAEFFDGHTFVNEKGAQFKAVVEYAPCQRVPKPCSKKDGREGTINKDPDYVEFLELISKPAETLPSAEIQLERKEAEKAGVKETLIVTPLMEFVRQKRAAKIGSQKLSSNVKLARRFGSVSISSSGSPSKRVSEKRRVPTMYVLKDSLKGGSAKDKSAYILVSRKEELNVVDKSAVASSSKEVAVTEDLTEADLNGTGTSGSLGTGRKKLVKGRERESAQASSSLLQQHTSFPVRNFPPATAKHNQRHDVNGRSVRSILSNKDARQSRSYAYGSQTEQQTHGNLEDKRPPRPPNMRLVQRENTRSGATVGSILDTDGKMNSDDKVCVKDALSSLPTAERYDRRSRNKDRPDRGVWTRLRRSEGTHVAGSTTSTEGGSCSQRDEDIGGRGSLSPAENGSHRHVVRRGLAAHGAKEVGTSIYDGKPPKKFPSSYTSLEKQVWVQKSGSPS